MIAAQVQDGPGLGATYAAIIPVVVALVSGAFAYIQARRAGSDTRELQAAPNAVAAFGALATEQQKEREYLQGELARARSERDAASASLEIARDLAVNAQGRLAEAEADGERLEGLLDAVREEVKEAQHRLRTCRDEVLALNQERREVLRRAGLLPGEEAPP